MINRFLRRIDQKFFQKRRGYSAHGVFGRRRLSNARLNETACYLGQLDVLCLRDVPQPLEGFVGIALRTAKLVVDPRASGKEVTQALRRVKGVASVDIHPHSSWIRVEYDPALASPRDLVKAVERIGYPVSLIK